MVVVVVVALVVVVVALVVVVVVAVVVVVVVAVAVAVAVAVVSSIMRPRGHDRGARRGDPERLVDPLPGLRGGAQGGEYYYC